MKRIIGIILTLILLISCNHTITEPPSSEATLNKKPIKPPPVTDPQFPELFADQKYVAGIAEGKVYLWEANDYQLLWSYSSDASLPKVGLADINSNGLKDLILLERLKGGKGKDKFEKYYFSIFYVGNTDPTRYEIGDFNDYTDAIWDMKIGDLDGDSQDEIVLVRRTSVEVWELDNLESPTDTYLYGYTVASTFPWEGEIVDFNNDGKDDALLVAFIHNFWARYEYDGGSINFVEQGTSYSNIGSLNLAKASDLDNDGNVEVVGGGSTETILIWENLKDIVPYDPPFPEYQFTWAFDIAEIDNNEENGKEILLGLSGGGLHLFHYKSVDGYTYDGELIPDISFSLNGLLVNDTGEIICATGSGLEIYSAINYSLISQDAVGRLGELVYQ